MRITRTRYLSPLACVLALGFTTSATRISTIRGDCATIYGGEVCTWATTSGDDLVGFGATVPMQSIKAAPVDAEMVWPPVPAAVIQLPAEVKERTGFNHLAMYWEAHGHPPAVFAVPHFDFHFYTVDPATVATMDCKDLSKPAQVPADYTLPDITVPELGELVGLCVPAMGMHAMPAKEVDQTKPFEASMIVGYYKGKVIFIEPMIAQTKLLNAKAFTMKVPKLTTAAANVRWPSAFEAVYDDMNQAYSFTFSGFGG